MKSQDILEKRGYSVVKHNDLIQKSRYDLSAQEQRIILYLVSKIKPEDNDLHSYEFEIKEFCEVCGIDYDNGANYKYIKQTLKGLRDKSIWITLENGKETTLAWIDKVTMDKRSGVVEIKIDDMMKPYLLQLKEKFTKYSLYFTLALKSKYSIRLYEILKSYQKLEQCEFEIDHLKTMIDAETHKLFANFKAKVLDIAVREINDCSDILVSYELEKQGRKFNKIKFTLKPKFIEPIEESIRTWKNIEKILNKP